MSAFLDAKRYLHLQEVGCVVDDDPTQLLRDLIEHVEKYGFKQELAARNIQLTNKVAVLELKLKETSKKHLAHIEYLQDQLSRVANCQTPSVGSPSPVKTVDPDSDLLSDPNFVPCRDERCSRRDLHAAHTSGMRGRGPNRKKDSHA